MKKLNAQKIWFIIIGNCVSEALRIAKDDNEKDQADSKTFHANY